MLWMPAPRQPGLWWELAINSREPSRRAESLASDFVDADLMLMLELKLHCGAKGAAEDTNTQTCVFCG